ncbi:MAG: DUF4886 domain-containing protein, partial [Ignavibacteriae bacterium]|nr:DUF4886 domain-containing protein [Ignavibacteriota bacterium]
MVLKIFIYTLILFGGSNIFGHTHQGLKDTSATKILFLGNSFTGWNDMPVMLEELTKNSSHKIYVDKYLKYGGSLYELSQLDTVKNIINSLKWDYIILQGSPYRYAYPEEFNTTYPIMTALEYFNEMIEENNPHAEIILFMPWAYKDGKFWDEEEPDDYSQMQLKIYKNIILMAKKLDNKIAPVGWAWNKIVFIDEEIELFIRDLTHPTIEGSYLTACVIYVTIFNEELIANPYISEISKNSAEFLQSVASKTVFGELENWNLLTNISVDRLDSFTLNQNYPNPFNSQTIISFTLTESKLVKLEIFNCLGEKITSLIDYKMNKGLNSYIFDAINL